MFQTRVISEIKKVGTSNDFYSKLKLYVQSTLTLQSTDLIIKDMKQKIHIQEEYKQLLPD